ncbi:MAG: sugar phosphate isomerase/epimerase family protein [Armatimonadota bacterium]
MSTPGIAAQLFTLRDFLKTPPEIAATMKRVREIGYSAVQLSALGPIEPIELAGILEREGLKAVITHTPFGRMVDDLPGVIADHRTLQCPNVAIGGMPVEYRNREGYMEFAKVASEIARRLHDAGLTFSYHNHSFEFERFEGKSGFQILFENSDPLVLSELDTYWVQHGGGDPAEWIDWLNGRMVVIHLKDMTISQSEQIMAEVGEGNLNWPRILDACRRTGIPWYAIEQDVCQRDPFESLAISLRNLKAMGV